MENIKIKKEEEIQNGWKFLVVVGGKGDSIEYLVVLDREYYESLTGKKYDPAELVKRSFDFLLRREPKESILREFNLREISRYFPEYEKEMEKQMRQNNQNLA